MSQNQNAIVPFQPQVINFPIPFDQIKKWAEEYMPLKVNGIEDKMGLAVCHKARMEVKEARVAVEKRRKELKADALEYGKQVDSAANELKAALEPIERHLLDQETAVEREKARIAAEEEAKRKAAWEAKMQGRIDALAKCNVLLLQSKLEALSDEEFSKLLADEQAKFEAGLVELRHAAAARKEEEERLAKERAELERIRKEQEARDAEIAKQRKAEEERQAAERAKLDAERKAQEEERQKLEAERRRLEAEEAERNRQAELEAERKRAAEEARLEAIEDQKRAEREAKERAEAEERERNRIEALRPDREKLLALAGQVGNIEVPKLSAAGAGYMDRASNIIHQADLEIRRLASELAPKKKPELQTA